MAQKSKTASGVTASGVGDSAATHTTGTGASPTCGGAAYEPQGLSSEVVSLLNEQAFATGEARTEREVCESFSEILLRHWNLCCVAAFLRDNGGGLAACTSFTHEHLDDSAARRIGEAMAAEVLRSGEEFRVGAWEETGDAAAAAEPLKEGDVVIELRSLFERAGLKAGVAVPICASGVLAGVLVVASKDAGGLREAVGGVRCVGQAVVIALGNARRSAAMNIQRRRIESLVEALRHRTAELEGANRELQRVGRYRSLFLARMSHELRTPLTSILGFAEILIDQEDLTETQRRFCGKIQSSGFQLQSSLNQLVDLSRLEAGQTELFLHEFSLRETLRESCVAVSRLAQKQEVRLDCTTAPEVGSIVSDEGKLRQVLYNFLAFAIGRSPSGGSVTVNTVLFEGERLRIEINDEGEPLEDPARLFEPVDIDAPNERGTNMNELGLVIAYRLLDVLGGSVTLQDLKPSGLSVHLNLPARPTET
ncbi:MAG: two-component system, NarL family, sensor histidine kinase BarA [Acidobacteriota bacterium]|nr:two-component system, NarL family, sensor histidine kinase BarA [Acidobacteriota bacterium]